MIITLSFVTLVLVIYNPPATETGGANEVVTALDNLLKLVFAPVIGLVGSVLGFYFGGRTVRKLRKDPTAPIRAVLLRLAAHALERVSRIRATFVDLR